MCSSKAEAVVFVVGMTSSSVLPCCPESCRVLWSVVSSSDATLGHMPEGHLSSPFGLERLHISVEPKRLTMAGPRAFPAVCLRVA